MYICIFKLFSVVYQFYTVFCKFFYDFIFTSCLEESKFWGIVLIFDDWLIGVNANFSNISTILWQILQEEISL